MTLWGHVFYLACPMGLCFQINCLQQLENIASHPFLRQPLTEGSLHLHAMWFCVRTAEMFYFSKQHKDFVPLDQELVEKILAL